MVAGLCPYELHGFGVSDGQDQCVSSAALGMDSGEDVAPLIAGTTWSSRALSYRCPNAPIGRFKTEACFILEAQPDPLVRICLVQFRQRLERFFGRQLGPLGWPPRGVLGAAAASTGAGVAGSASRSRDGPYDHGVR